MMTTNTGNVSAEQIARYMLASAGFANDEQISQEYEDPFYETTEEFIVSLCDRIPLHIDNADGSTLDTRSYVEPYINQILFNEEVAW